MKKRAATSCWPAPRKLYKAVRTTMGPRGRNVVIGKRGHGPTVTHDGVTVAKAVHVRDEAENIGAELIKEAANRLNDVAGDGTTTVTVLTYHLLPKRPSSSMRVPTR
jgi:chaperonin GroEL